MRLRLSLAALSLCASLLPAVARAQWAANGDSLCTAAKTQQNVAITADGLGDAVVAWEDLRNGSSTDIYARPVSPLGAPLWSPTGIPICTAANGQQNVRVVHDGYGYLYYLWEDFRGADEDLYLAITDRLGNVFTPGNGTPLCNASGNQSGFGVAVNSILGVVYAAWTDTRSNAGDIYLQGFDLYNYAFMGTNGTPICTLSSLQAGPVVCDNEPAHDGAIVAWQDYRSGTNFDIYAQSANLSGGTYWTGNGVPVCTQAAAQTSPMIVSDGAGGAIIAWQDARNGSGHNALYGQRLDSNGNKLWLPADGVPLATSTDLIILPKMIPDGSGGAILAWEDDRNIATTGGDIYAQRVTGGGTVLWGTNGVPVCTASFDQDNSDVCSDGAGGCVIAWQDLRVIGPADIYAQRVAAGGTIAWSTANGVLVSGAAGNQFQPKVALTGDGGVIVAWQDSRISDQNIWTQRLDLASGNHGHVEPYITSIVDRPSDEGYAVRITFLPGDTDIGGTEYEIHDVEYHGDDIVGLLTNNGSGSYTADVLNTGVGVANHYHIFGSAESNTVAGVAIDNLAPPAPTLPGSRHSGNIGTLSWNATGTDIDNYEVIRADLGKIGVPGSPGWTDVGPPIGELHYYVYGIDIHGNIGPHSNTLIIPTAVGVDGGAPAPRVLTLAPNRPNPFAGGTTLRFGLPREDVVRLSVFNVAGRRVVSREPERLAAGWHELAFAARDDRQRPLPGGIYFYRLEVGGESVHGRMVITR